MFRSKKNPRLRLERLILASELFLAQHVPDEETTQYRTRPEHTANFKGAVQRAKQR